MKVCVIITARPSYARIQTALRALQPRCELSVVCAASALLPEYGRVVDVVRADGFATEEVWSAYAGNSRATTAQETGALLTALVPVLTRLQPDRVVVIADRHEVLAAAQAAAYLHLPLCHIQGGERTGSIDDKVRHAITQLADLHCVSTEQAKFHVYGLTGQMGAIHQTGCPSIDLAREAALEPSVQPAELGGVGPDFDLSKPFVVLLQHPVTNESAEARAQMEATLTALGHVGLPVVAFWPGQDAGSDPMAKALREWREAHPDARLHAVRNLPPTRFLRLLTQCAALVGNSSVGIREASYLGVPVGESGLQAVGTRARAERAGRARMGHCANGRGHRPPSRTWPLSVQWAVWRRARG